MFLAPPFFGKSRYSRRTTRVVGIPVHIFTKNGKVLRGIDKKLL